MQNITSIFYFVFYKDILPYVDMKFDLKLFVLVGILAGLRDVWGGEKNKDDGFIVEELKDDQKKELNAAMTGNRVIKAVYTPLSTGQTPIIDVGFRNKLSNIVVWDGNDGETLKPESFSEGYPKLFRNM